MNEILEQLKQLRELTWDGHVLSKSHRDALYGRGYVQRVEGWNWLTVEGVKLLIILGELKP